MVTSALYFKPYRTFFYTHSLCTTYSDTVIHIYAHDSVSGCFCMEFSYKKKFIVADAGIYIHTRTHLIHNTLAHNVNVFRSNCEMYTSKSHDKIALCTKSSRMSYTVLIKNIYCLIDGWGKKDFAFIVKHSIGSSMDICSKSNTNSERDIELFQPQKS